MGFRDHDREKEKERKERSRTQQWNDYLIRIGGDVHTGFPPNIKKMFDPRPPVQFKEPTEKKTLPRYTGLAQFMSAFAEPSDPEYAPEKVIVETPAEKREKAKARRLQHGVDKISEQLPKYDPWADPNARGDPYKTLFVSNLSYDVTEKKLEREFARYGTVRRPVRIVLDTTTGKPRGYAFIEFKHRSAMRDAYGRADGTKINNRRIKVDVERGRTVKNWRPLRLGGGLGEKRLKPPVVVVKPRVQIYNRNRPSHNRAKRRRYSPESSDSHERKERMYKN